MNYYLILIVVVIVGAILQHLVKKQNERRNRRHGNIPNELKDTISALSPSDDSSKDFSEDRAIIDGNKIYINNSLQARCRDVEIFPVFDLNYPQLHIYENGRLWLTFDIESRVGYPDISNRYLHSSIRINSNSSVQMDGIISGKPDSYDKDGEGIRFQPFFMSDKNSLNDNFKGKGLFHRGLHFSGFITPTNIRFICICDECRNSFSLEFFHAGFSEVQYLYSANSEEMLVVRYGVIEGIPFQLQKDINPEMLECAEKQLSLVNDGGFKYYNSLKCPHCLAPYIDFENNKDLRPTEYYANFYLNKKPVYLN